MHQLPINIIYGQLIVIFIVLFIIFPVFKIFSKYNKSLFKKRSWGICGLLIINFVKILVIWYIYESYM